MSAVDTRDGLQQQQQPLPFLERAVTQISEVIEAEAGTMKSAVSTAPSAQWEERSLAKSTVLVTTLSLSMITNVAASQAANIALPTIGRELDFSTADLQWIVSAFAITAGSGLLLFGRLADIYGRRRVFLMANIWFILWSVGCALAPTRFSLIFMRALQGLGPAAFIPAAMGILGRSFKPSPFRSIAFATFSAGAPVGSALGSIMGGFLTEYGGKTKWRSVFYVLAGLSAITICSGVLTISPDQPYEGTDRSVDWLGAALITSSFVLLLFVLAQGEVVGWHTAYIIALCIVAVLLFIVFLGWEYRLEQEGRRAPLVRLSIFRVGKLSIIMAMVFLAFSNFNAFLFWATVFYQQFKLLSPIQTTLRFLPTAIMGILVNFMAAILLPIISGHYILIMGAIGVPLASILFATSDPSLPYWAMEFVAFCLSVIGVDFVFAPSALYCSSVVGPHEQAVVGGVLQTAQMLGVSFGLAITTIVYDRTQDASDAIHPYRMAFWTATAFGLASLILTVFGLRGIGVLGHKKGLKAEEKADAEAGWRRAKSGGS